MHEMMARLDVDPGVLVRLKGGMAYSEARARCLFCGTSDKCLRWLDEQNRAMKDPSFCPNLPLFQVCKKPGDREMDDTLTENY
jgi:hypothetical protein